MLLNIAQVSNAAINAGINIVRLNAETEKLNCPICVKIKYSYTEHLAIDVTCTGFE